MKTGFGKKTEKEPTEQGRYIMNGHSQYKAAKNNVYDEQNRRNYSPWLMRDTYMDLNLIT